MFPASSPSVTSAQDRSNAAPPQSEKEQWSSLTYTTTWPGSKRLAALPIDRVESQMTGLRCSARLRVPLRTSLFRRRQGPSRHGGGQADALASDCERAEHRARAPGHAARAVLRPRL